MKIPSNVRTFAMSDENLKTYEMFRDYYNHYLASNGKKVFGYDENISFSEKEEKMNAALKREIIRVAGVQSFSDFPVEQWATNPMISWATWAVVSTMIDMILPDSIIDTIGLYTDVRVIGWGDSAAFDVESRDLFVVSKSGRSQRSSEVHKQFKGQVTLLPEMHEITVQVSLYKVLCGLESLAAFVMKIVRSMETQVALEAYTAFETAMAALPSTTTTGLQVSGYSQDSLVRLCEQVTAWNQGNKAIVVGTQRALVNVLPDDANYRYELESDFVKIGFIRTAFGYDVLALPQVAKITTPWSLALSNSYLYILSPSAPKLLKMVLEGTTLSNTDTTFQNANLMQNSTLWKSWGIGVATSATAGVIAL